jgi:hypothetical protein
LFFINFSGLIIKERKIMTHFICIECRGLAEIPGVCQTPDCAQNGDPLEECNCEDDAHADLNLRQKADTDDADLG